MANETQAEGEWLVWSFEHDSWWRQASCGYTRSIDQAGRYTRARAEEIVRNANRGRAEPNEAMLPVPSPPSRKPLCISCGEPATEKAGKGGGTGSDLCARCWRAEFSDPAEGD